MMEEMNRTVRQATANQAAPKEVVMQRTLNWFVISLLIASIGAGIGNQLSPELYFPLLLTEIVLLVAAFIVRANKSVPKVLGYPILIAFAFVSGLTIGPVLTHYFAIGAGNAVLMAFATTTVSFIAFAVIGAKVKKDLQAMGKILLIALIVLVVVTLFGMFIPLTSGTSTIISGAGALLFSLYIVYDFNQMMKRTITLDDVPILALNLYLDFVNLFLYLLRLFAGRD
ncbi:hypothetical protein HCJ80_04510 [Listeria grayi]|nr:hypothetical protein [Listeria grayi]